VAREDPLEIMGDCQAGMVQVGERYEEQEYFLSGLIMGGEIFGQIIKLLQPVVEDKVPDCLGCSPIPTRPCERRSD
jgi:methanogenic corrinoid protein MtbC1